MNGTIYEEIKKNENSKKREKLKFIVALISTNVLVAILCFCCNSDTKNLSPTKTMNKTIHPHFKMIVAPLTVLIDNNSTDLETPITLIDKSKKILIKKAYLHELQTTSSRESESTPRFKIEIPETEVLKISADSSVEMVAIPELKILDKLSKTKHRRVSEYEINL